MLLHAVDIHITAYSYDDKVVHIIVMTTQITGKYKDDIRVCV